MKRWTKAGIFPFLAILLVPEISLGQIKSYDSAGHPVDAADERVLIHVDTATTNRAFGLPVSLPSALGALITLGIDVATNIASNKEQQFMATYSATSSQRGLMVLERKEGNASYQLNIAKIQIKRMLILADNRETPACIISLEPDIDRTNGYFRFKLSGLELYSTKARIRRRGTAGKWVDLSVTVKLDAYWLDQAKVIDTSAGSHTPNKPATSDSEMAYKTATLGQSTFILPGIKPVGTILLPDDPIFTGWFQLLPTSALDLKKADGSYKMGDYELTVTIKEVNPYELTAKKVSDFLSTSSPDIQSFIKQITTPASK